MSNFRLTNKRSSWHVPPRFLTLVSVSVRLVRSLNGDSDIVGLLLGEDGEVSSEGAEVEPGDLLVEELREDEDVSTSVLSGVLLLPELELGEGLVGEGGGHDEGRVAGGASEVEEAALSEDDDGVSILEDELVDLGLDVVPSGDLHEALHVDLVVEVTDVSNDGVVLHLLHGVGHEDSLVSGSGDEDVGLLDDLPEGDNGEALHARLKGADGVNLGDVDDASAGPHGLGASLSDISESADDGLLSGHHDVGGAHKTVGERVLAAVKVVELGLGDGVVDVNGREEEGSGLLHGVEAVDTGGGLLGDSHAPGSEPVPLVLDTGLEEPLDDGEDNLELSVVGGGRVGEGSVLGEGVLGLLSLVDEEGHVSSVIDNEVRSISLSIIGRPGDGGESALPVLLEGLSLPGEDGGGLIAGDGSGGVVLGREDVAGAPPHISSEVGEGFDEDGSLNGHVEGSSDTGSLERSGFTVLSPGTHKSGHLNLSNLDLLATVVGEANISNLVIS